ncbi:DUF6434 domain-containing protein [Streptomyces xanthophaeus]|uniref:DUF6434 domain-containing protein n=1 Tax=Streptomyces xanthophaeus TaxID=67385 RepID=A0A919LJN9_9ACTN|nr:DUF6434 domain-containing protein [Streptomyces xanthophaeus]WST25301.1 SAP domain-containing protein [Streptomyces xanthophaeus]WST59725.1 SAP domain-containing protein [Streptomyces xanthophaeus]GHI86704.1 hypothetical protein Sxan_40680 [Streptomyces xanthophaeus]
MRTNDGDPGAPRPALTRELSGTELVRWYWTLAELTAFARQLGLSPAGGKAALTDRLAAVLDGRPEPRPVRTARRGGRQLAAPVDGATVIPEGQRCSQVLRAYFTQEIGPAFHFDAFMRDYVAQGAGRTLAQAVTHWHATRERAAEPQEVGAQFEFNRFLREWHARHPDATRTEALAAWRAHRARPKDRRD